MQAKPVDPAGFQVDWMGSVSSGVGASAGLPVWILRMHRRLTPIPQEEVSMVSSCMTQGLLIVENAG